VEISEADHAKGFLELEKARIKWSLSINEDHLPAEVRKAGKRTYRSLTMNGNEIEFSDGFTELHTTSYKEILAGRGFGLAEAKPSIELAYHLRGKN
jgi:UDP-N-acetyl-2-amino-2-deoxyglucuronate dehydrogenase